MARTLYAGRPGDTVTALFAIGERLVYSLPADANGDPTAVTLTVWDEPDGTQLTDLLAADGTTPITAVTVPPGAVQIPAFYGPDGVTDELWLRDPDGDYTRLDLGPTGAPGAPGATGGAWFSGTSAPAGGTGAVGDWYINTATSDVYKKTATSTWTLQMNIKGAAGTNGTNGTNGSNGVGVPAGGTTGQVLKKNSGTNYDTAWGSLGTAAARDTGTGGNQIPILGASPGTPNGSKFLRDDGTWATPSGGGSTAPLASVSRTSASNSSYTTTSTTPVDVDATNLAITFTAPASGAVQVRLEGVFSNTSTSFSGYWSLRSGSTNVTGSERQIGLDVTAARVHADIRVTGLTPGTSYTYKWAHRAGSSAATVAIYYGGTEFSGTPGGPITMEVYAA